MRKLSFHHVHGRKVLFSLLLILFCYFTSGCMSYMRGIMYDIPRVIGKPAEEKPLFYLATYGDGSFFWEMGIRGKPRNISDTEPGANLWIRLPFFTLCCLIDLPFSLAYDTLLLPFDCGYWIYFHNNEKKDITR